MHLTATDLAWPAVVAAGIAVFWLPVGIAAARRVDGIGVVVLLTLLTLGTGVLWFAALGAAFMMPRRPPAPQPAAWRHCPTPGATPPLLAGRTS